MSPKEFLGITGIGIKNSNYNNYNGPNVSTSELENKEFELDSFIDKVYSLKQASEIKIRVKEDLLCIIKKINEATFPINELNK